MTLTFEVSDRFESAASEWADARMTDVEDAIETKVEQALLEIEHLTADATEVEFELDGRSVSYAPSDELSTYLESQAADTGLDPSTVLKLHVDLYAGAFDLDDAVRPPNAPPKE
ncbi:MAG: hypothetical protein ABEK02_08190 [Haloquadratum sp.]